VYHGEYRKLKSQARFIREIMDNELVVSRKKKAVIVQELRDRKYEAFPKNAENVNTKSDEENAEAEAEQAEEDGAGESASDYDYLLSMAIWSFTQERLDKLKEQIVKKKVQHDELEALSEKDLWMADLDEFEVEWENQLRLEAEITTSIRRMGRRASKKIGAGAGGKGRKVKDDDDYAPVAKSKTVAKAAKPKVVERKTQDTFAAKFTAKSEKRAMGGDAAADESDAFSDDDYAALKSSHNKKPVVASKPSAVAEFAEDVDMSDAPAPAPAPVAGRSKRAAASKAKTWVVDDDSEEDTKDFNDDIDIGDLVKGIPGGSADSGENKSGRVSLFAMSRPESSHGTGAATKSVKTKPSKTFDFDSHDDTNYEMLAKPSPHKTVARDEVDELLSEDSDDDDILPAKPAAKAKASELKPGVSKARGKAAAATTKAKPAPAVAKKAAAKPLQLSPAAKMYAKKKTTAPKPKTDPFDMSDDEEDDIAEPVSPVSKPAARSRPGRAAATKKKHAYQLSDDDEDDDVAAPPADEDEDSDPYGLNESDD
jgi:DNA topoisomerase II